MQQRAQEQLHRVGVPTHGAEHDPIKETISNAVYATDGRSSIMNLAANILLGSKSSFSFQIMTSNRQYSMENLATDIL